jgi:uncharacterized phiE125 gp8 family phage protein
MNSIYESKLELDYNDSRRVALPGGFKIVAQPAEEPLELAFVKNYLKVDYDADDALITHLIKGARSSAEQFLNMGLIEQSVQEQIASFPLYRRMNPHQAIILKRGPIVSVTSIVYYDEDNAQQTLSASRYTVQQATNILPAIAPVGDEGWPSTYDRIDAIQITYKVGYASASDIPVDILDAMLLMISDQYDNRTDGVRTLPTGSQLKLLPHRLDAFR